MGLFGNWKTVDDTYVFQPQALVRFYVEYFFIPATAPSSDEWKEAFRVIGSIDVQSVERSGLSRANVGADKMVIIGIMQDSLSAGQLRGKIINAYSVLNANRYSPTWSMNVDDIQASDTRSALKSIGINLPGDTSGGPEPGQNQEDSSGFAISTTVIVVSVAAVIIAIAAVVHKGEGLL